MARTVDEAILKQRTKELALGVIRSTESLPRGRATDILGRQLLRSGTSVGANYRSVCRARSDADMFSKLGVVEEEADESQFWIELMRELDYGSQAELDRLHQEFGEIVAISVAARRTLKRRLERDGNRQR